MLSKALYERFELAIALINFYIDYMLKWYHNYTGLISILLLMSPVYF